MKITNREYNLIVKELANRFRDLTWLSLEEKFKKKTPKKVFENWTKGNDCEINYIFTCIFNDVLQIIARIRRK